MTDQNIPPFEKEGKISVWISTFPYNEIPDSYFEEDEQGLGSWAHNFKIGSYDPEDMETNGADTGTVHAEKAIGECSCSQSYIDAVTHKIKKMGISDLTWVIIMFDFEYRPKKTKVYKDEFVQYVGSFPYDDEADCVSEPKPQ
jgi:hypothetical protein